MALTDLHRDRFEWVLESQAQAERIALLTCDAHVACPGPMRPV